MADIQEQEGLATKITGHVKIRDPETGEVFLNKRNAVHYENASVALARSWSDQSTGFIHEMHFGNGGAIVSGTGAITYFPPNVTGPNASLYNDTFFKVINDQSPLDIDPLKNFITVQHILNTVYTDIIITCTLDYQEPSGQAAFDDATDLTGTYVFNEIGLKAFDPTPGNGLLLTHIVFNPIQKSLNRLMEIVYTLRIQMA